MLDLIEELENFLTNSQGHALFLLSFYFIKRIQLEKVMNELKQELENFTQKLNESSELRLRALWHINREKKDYLFQIIEL